MVLLSLLCPYEKKYHQVLKGNIPPLNDLIKLLLFLGTEQVPCFGGGGGDGITCPFHLV